MTESRQLRKETSGEGFLEIIQKADEQYKVYRDLTEVTLPLKKNDDEPRLPIANWRSPLDLTFYEDG